MDYVYCDFWRDWEVDVDWVFCWWNDCCVYVDDIIFYVEEWIVGIIFVDCCICLDEIVIGVGINVLVVCWYNIDCYCVVEFEWVVDCYYLVVDLYFVGIVEFYGF